MLKSKFLLSDRIKVSKAYENLPLALTVTQQHFFISLKMKLARIIPHLRRYNFLYEVKMSHKIEVQVFIVATGRFVVRTTSSLDLRVKFFPEI